MVKGTLEHVMKRGVAKGSLGHVMKRGCAEGLEEDGGTGRGILRLCVVEKVW